MGVRRQAREIAVQILYALEFRGDFDSSSDIFKLPEIEPLYLSLNLAVRSYVQILVQGVTREKVILDKYLSLSSLNWSLYRMARVDRAILRVGAYEMLAVSEVPPSVAIDEALEIAKLYSSDEAPMYINGVLDKVSGLLNSSSVASVETGNVEDDDQDNEPKVASGK